MKTTRPGNTMLRSLALATAFTLAWAPGGVATASPPDDETSVETRPASGARAADRQAAPDDVATYSRREQRASTELASFTGGDRTVLVITSSTLIIILLVVLIVVLV